MIYAIKATPAGRIVCVFGNDKVNYKRTTLIAMGYNKYKSMEDLTSALHLLEEAADEQVREDFMGYWENSKAIVDDLRWLEAHGLLVLARYRVFQEGRYKYAPEREKGLHFHGD